jgi:2-oxoglutarate dehydrogenase E2 component (dihydrolipoamide succinyltransferase)
MPQMGESIAEGTLSRWLKQVGDEVKRDEPIFEISTDKVDAEIPAPAAGVLAEVLVKEGETVPVQTVVARLESDVAAYMSGDAPAAEPAGAGDAAVSGAAASGKAAGGAPPTGQSTPESAPSPKQSAAVSAGITPSPATGDGNSFEDRIRTKSSPLVRKMAAEHGVELGALRGSGVAGRVTKRDLLAHLESAPQERAAAGSAGASMHAPGGAGDGAHGPMPEPWPGDQVEPMSKMRAIISGHMTASRRTSAHVTSFFEVDFTRVARIRAAKRVAFEQETGQKLTYMPFVIKSVVDGLRKFPILNSSVAGTNIIYRKQYNIGIAVALDWGLIVPVIKGAENLSLTGLTKALNDLAGRARAKRLDPREVQDATFTITNFGVFGSLMGTPIISQPQVAILGLGAIEKRPKVVTGPDGEDTIAIRTCCYLSLSFDHRIIDGATADQFLSFVKQQIESYPETGV